MVVTWEDSLVISYKTQHTCAIWCNNHIFGTHPKELKIYLHQKKKKLHTNVYIGYTRNGQNLEAAKMLFSRYIQKMGYDWFSAKKKWHGGAVNANYYLKEANLKRLHTEWFQVCDILKKAKLKIVKDQQFLGAGKRDAVLLNFFF